MTLPKKVNGVPIMDLTILLRDNILSCVKVQANGTLSLDPIKTTELSLKIAAMLDESEPGLKVTDGIYHTR